MKKVTLLLLLVVIGYNNSYCDVLKKLGYNFNISNFEKCLKLVDKIKIKENSDYELKKLMRARIYLARRENALALNEVNGLKFKDYTLKAQTIKIIALGESGKNTEDEISKWYELETKNAYRTYNSDFINFSFALYKSGNTDEALKLIRQYYNRSKYDNRVVFFEIFESCYLYEQGEYEKIEVILKDLKSSHTKKIPAKIENARLFFWRALIYHKLGNSAKAKSNYFEGVKLRDEISKTTRVHVEIARYINPYVYFFPSNNVISDFLTLCDQYSTGENN